VYYVKSMPEINLEYIFRPVVSNRVHVSAHHGVNGWHGAITRGVQILDIIFGINANFPDNLCAHVFVNRNYEGKMRYRNRIRESSDARYRSFGRRLPCTNLHVNCVLVEIKNSFTELLNVNGVIRGQCGACGRNVSVKKFSQ
jgi:hypothetical protein